MYFNIWCLANLEKIEIHNIIKNNIEFYFVKTGKLVLCSFHCNYTTPVTPTRQFREQIQIIPEGWEPVNDVCAFGSSSSIGGDVGAIEIEISAHSNIASYKFNGVHFFYGNFSYICN